MKFLRGVPHVFAMVVLALVCAGARAADVDPDDVRDLKLAPDEGLVVLAIEDSAGTTAMRWSGAATFVVNRIGMGRNLRVLRLRAGDYRPTTVELAESRLNIPSEWPLAFTVQAGVLNYVGDFDIRRWAFKRMSVERQDRATRVLFGLDKRYPGLRGKFAWRTALASPDSYAEFVHERFGDASLLQVAESADADAKKAREAAIEGPARDLAKELLSDDRVSHVVLSPNGDLLAYVEHVGDRYAVVVSDLDSGVSVPVVNGFRPVAQLVWTAPRLLLADMDALELRSDMPAAVKKEPADAGTFRIALKTGPLAPGSYTRTFFAGTVHTLDGRPDDPRWLLYVRVGDDARGHVYRVDKTTPTFDITQFQSQYRLDKGLEELVSVKADRDGRLRVALAWEKDHRALMSVDTTTGKWRRIHAFGTDDKSELVTVDADGKSVLVLTNEDRAQVELVRIGLDDGAIQDTVFRVPGADLANPVVRPRDGTLLSVESTRGGAPIVHTFEAALDRRAALVAEQFPGASVATWDVTGDGRRALMFVRSDVNPGSYYLYDAQAHRLEKLVDVRPAFEHARPASVVRFQARAADGLAIDALLTLPPGATGLSPVVVAPHGGPIGAKDVLDFDPYVQFLANRGYAVLRANYRGSGGSGRSFEEAGLAAWGRQIEDDIEAALSSALDRYPLDRNRVALLGASYGGYSTLMGLIRAPERYRCGVAISAVSDLPLLFNANDWFGSKAAAAIARKIVGDPQRDLERMREVSPVYQYARLTRPLLLVHGTLDERVPFEHALRLRTLLALAGHAPSFLPVPGGDHNLAEPAQRLAVYGAADRFLAACLAPQGAPAASATAPAAAGKPGETPL